MDTIGRHMLFGYAKRLRPTFVMLAQQMFWDEALEAAVECAAVSELIHCASLFHDDVIDGAKTRKGRRAASAVWGNKSAVIVGDYFFVLAYSLLAKQQDLKLIEIYIDTCRTLAEGVMLELGHMGDVDISEEAHLEIITRKTATFFQTTALVGGYSGGADDDQQEHLREFGLNFGLAFQLSDDLLDLYADPAATGKPRGTDIRSGIYTTAVIRALASNPDFHRTYHEILKGDGLTSEVIDEIVEALRTNGAFQYTRELIQSYGNQALRHLDALPDGRAGAAFRALVQRILARRY